MANGTIVEVLRKPASEPIGADTYYVPLYEPRGARLQLEEASSGLQYFHNMDLAHGDLKGVRFLHPVSNDGTYRNAGSILISDDGRACLADTGLTRVAGATTVSSQAPSSKTSGVGIPELLDPERFESTRGGPTKKSYTYSMAMTTYEMCPLRYKLTGQSVEVALGSDG